MPAPAGPFPVPFIHDNILWCRLSATQDAVFVTRIDPDPMRREVTPTGLAWRDDTGRLLPVYTYDECIARGLFDPEEPSCDESEADAPGYVTALEQEMLDRGVRL